MPHNSVRLIFFHMQSIAQKKVLVYMHLFVGGGKFCLLLHAELSKEEIRRVKLRLVQALSAEAC